MLPRLLTIWENIRTSLWALPLAMIAVATAIALVAVSFPIRTGGGDPVWFLYSGNAKDAPGFLSNLVTATITLATLAISITMVVLTLAAQQLGPRLIRIFMSDLRTQTMLGLFVATVVYLVLVLRSVYGDTVPNLAVTIGTALVLLSTLVLLLFVHHLARSIIADNVIESVGTEIDGSVKRLLPEKTENRTVNKTRPTGKADELRLSCEGYIQAVDHSKLIAAARAHNCVIELGVRAGHLLIPGIVVGKVWPAEACTLDLTKTIATGIIAGRDRTPVQDIEFSIRQMVEVGVRALSPGVNDPYTALVTIDRLSLSLAHAMARGDAKQEWYDENDTLRLIVQTSSFSGLLDAGYNMLRQYGEGSPTTLIRLAERLGDLYELGDGAQRKHIARHLEMVLRAGRRTLPEPNDLAVLEDRIPRAVRITSAAG